MVSTDLEIQHCEQTMNQELMIGRDNARDGKRKQFGFHVWLNEYRVTHDGVIIDSGQAIEELLEVYNEL